MNFTSPAARVFSVSLTLNDFLGQIFGFGGVLLQQETGPMRHAFAQVQIGTVQTEHVFVVIGVESRVLVIGRPDVEEYHPVAIFFGKGFEYVCFAGCVVDGESLLAV